MSLLDLYKLQAERDWLKAREWEGRISGWQHFPSSAEHAQDTTDRCREWDSI